MNGARWRVGLPQPGQTFFANDGRGGGAAGEVSSVTIANNELLGTYVGNARDEVYAHPLGSNNLDVVLDHLRNLPNEMKGSSERDLTLLAKRLVVLATRTPWVDFPTLSAEPGYAESWQREIPARAAFYFKKAVDAVVKKSTPIVGVATFLEERCDDIYDGKALLFMFGGCVAALPQDRHKSLVKALLSTMIRRDDLCDAEKLPDRLDPIKGVIAGLSREQFGDIYLTLRGIDSEMLARDPRSQIGVNFIGGVCDLYFVR